MKLKILLIANSTDCFGKELKAELIARNYDVSLLDFESLTLYDNDKYKNNKYSRVFLRYKSIPKISMLFRMWYVKKIIQENNFDILNIHISRWFYLVILPWIVKQKLVITFYGSDFYRTSELIKNIQTILYKKADAITFTNPLTKKSFVDYYKNFENKSYLCRFGLRTLDFIDKNRSKSKVDIKKSLGYSTEKLIVTCGYNSTKEQQHEVILRSLNQLPLNVLDKIQFIFPLTYGDSVHKELIKNLLKGTNLDYKIHENFLYDDDNANIKLASDVMINILKTDSFSGSMQEFLYAGNIVITGYWLPYEVFDKAGVQYIKINSTDELSKVLEEVAISDLNNFDTTINRTAISDLSHWSNSIEGWLNVFSTSIQKK